MAAKPVRLGLAGVAFGPFYAFGDEEYQTRAKFFASQVNRLTCEVEWAPRPFRTAAEAGECAAFLRSKAVDAVVLDVCTFPEGKAWQAFVSQLPLPVILWSRPEARKNGPVGHNSFCGANFIMANLRREGRRCRAWFGAPDSPEFLAQVRTALQTLNAAKAVRGARIGLVGGGIVPKFNDLDLSETERARLAEAWDIRFVGLPLDEVLTKARAIAASAARAEAERQAAAYRAIQVPPAALEQQARLVLALRAEAQRDNLSALAIRCWPEFQSQADFWPCGTVGWLCEGGLPTACEGDPVGALDMLLAGQLSKRPSTLLDIIDFDDARDTLSVWHCGPSAPACAADRQLNLVAHAVDGADAAGQPRAGHPACHDLTLRPGPVALLRTLGALDDEFRLDGEILPADGEQITGSFGKAGRLSLDGRPIAVAEVRRRILNEGIPHHYTLFSREN